MRSSSKAITAAMVINLESNDSPAQSFEMRISILYIGTTNLIGDRC
jgi:hypothetical protein